MGGIRLEKYWAAEMRAVIEKYRQFETLIPSRSGNGSGHPGEDGRYIESILRATLKQFLPESVEVFSGFILRAGVKSTESAKPRRRDEDQNSGQLDLIVYDMTMPIYQRFGETAVVPPEGVLGVISVKKSLYSSDLEHEFAALKKVAELCAQKDKKGPFIALVGMDDKIGQTVEKSYGRVTDAISKIQDEKCIAYDELPGFVGTLKGWSIHKVHRKDKRQAEYLLYKHRVEEEHLGIQFLLNGILDVYYSADRDHGKKPAMFSFPRGRQPDEMSCVISYKKEKAGRHC